MRPITVLMLAFVFSCTTGEAETHGCHVPWPDPPEPTIDASPLADADCSHCDDGTPDKPGMPACPDVCFP